MLLILTTTPKILDYLGIFINNTLRKLIFCLEKSAICSIVSFTKSEVLMNKIFTIILALMFSTSVFANPTTTESKKVEETTVTTESPVGTTEAVEVETKVEKKK
ncbi:MAG: hypothetical protein ACRYE9_01380 [Janthinobacterium lividum]